MSTDLQNLIIGSYGSEDLKFALHPQDRKRALQSLILADKEETGFEEFIELHIQYLTDKDCSENHISEQLERVKKIETYFGLD